jgi:hypothetical protein
MGAGIYAETSVPFASVFKFVINFKHFANLNVEFKLTKFLQLIGAIKKTNF